MMRLLSPLLLLLTTALLSGQLLWSSALLNFGYVNLLRAGWVTARAADSATRLLWAAAERREDAAIWGLGMLARWQGDEAHSRSLWLHQLDSMPRHLSLFYVLFAGDQEFAQEAHRLYPRSWLAAYWLGEVMAPGDLPAAIALYEETLAEDSGNGVRWVELGWLYRRNGQHMEALVAYGRGCALRDRGGNGCWQAGLLSQELGLEEQAADYYRLTLRQIPNYAPALARLAGLRQ